MIRMRMPARIDTMGVRWMALMVITDSACLLPRRTGRGRDRSGVHDGGSRALRRGRVWRNGARSFFSPLPAKRGEGGEQQSCEPGEGLLAVSLAWPAPPPPLPALLPPPPPPNSAPPH